jgi:ABC-type transport system substrate-binding protein
VGVASDTPMIPVQRQRESEYRATFPSFELLNGPPSDVQGLAGLYSSRARVPANNFIGSNYSRYMNPEFDAMLDRYFTTIPTLQRTEALGQIIYHIADQLVSMGLFYSDRPIIIGQRIQNVSAPGNRDATQAWNSFEWDVK